MRLFVVKASNVKATGTRRKDAIMGNETNKKTPKKQEFSSCSFVRMRARCSLSLGRLLRTKLDEERELLYRKKHTC